MSQRLRLKKGEDRRIRSGGVWIFSNEIDTKSTPLNKLTPGIQVHIEAQDGTFLGVAYANPHSLITARLISRDPHAELNLEFFVRQMRAALQLREHLFPKKPFYRLIFGEGDGLPGLIVDRFSDILVVQLNTAGMEIRKELIIEALKTILPQTAAILFRNDSPIRQHEGLELYTNAALGTPPERIQLEENGALFTAPLWKGQKTGWFYDHRLNRARLKEYVANKKVLDVFSYLGAWGIEAAVANAQSVTCIESSEFAAGFIKENAELNQVADKVRIIREDAFSALKTLQQQAEQFDVIVLDPPAFIKKQKDRQEGLRAYQRLFELALKLLTPNGLLCACSCSMHLSYDDLLHLLQRASLKTQRPLHIIERGHQGPDHPIHLNIPETDYLKMVLLRCV